MPLIIDDFQISKVLIVDDDPAARDAYRYVLEELDIEPIFQTDRMDGDLGEVLKGLRQKADGMVSDYHLRKKGNMSSFEGDELVAAANEQKFPSLLCTTYTNYASTVNRSYRRFIPALLPTDDYEPALIEEAFRECLSEGKGIYKPSRRPWRTLVRVEEVEERLFYVIVPGWNTDKKIPINKSDVPAEVVQLLKPNFRVHAQVNTGASDAENLFFADWETK